MAEIKDQDYKEPRMNGLLGIKIKYMYGKNMYMKNQK